MKYLWLFSTLGSTLLAVPAGCSPTAEEQVGTFARDFVLQALAAYLF
jgi:hypothetical protein